MSQPFFIQITPACLTSINIENIIKCSLQQRSIEIQLKENVISVHLV